jgi:hypothetical protein
MQELKKIVIEPKPHIREGITFRFAGEELDADGNALSEFIDIELVVPPLNLDSFKALGADLATLTFTADSGDKAVNALMHALARNYRGVPRWLIGQSVDLGNMTEIMQAFMDVSGLHRKEVEEKKAMAAGPMVTEAASLTQIGTQSIAS